MPRNRPTAWVTFFPGDLDASSDAHAKLLDRRHQSQLNGGAFMTQPQPPAGWFPDPTDPSRLRYFDGKLWTQQYANFGAPLPQVGQPPKAGMSRGMKIALAVVAAVVGLSILGSIGNSGKPSQSRSDNTAGSVFSQPTTESGFTPSQDNAIEKAQSYLSTGDFSRKGLIEQLEYNKFSNADATFAVERIEATGGVNWISEAIDKAQSYLRTGSFSLQGLIEQLEYNGFTPDQAELGANQAYNSR